MDVNLNTLKREIEEALATAGFAIFRSSPGLLEDLPMVLWDSAQYPDYQLFLETARKAGAALMLFATRDFEAEQITEALEQIEECDLERPERRELESRLRALRTHQGATCSLELAFSHDGHMYVYEVTPDWYDEFLDVTDEIAAHLHEDDDGEDESLNGYFSRN